MEITNDINELQSICKELKRLYVESKKLRQRKSQLESNILNYLKDTEQTAGIIYNNVVLQPQDKQIFKRKGLKDKLSAGSKYLEEIGVDDGKKILTNLFDVIKGSPIAKMHLKMIQKSK